MILCFAVSLPLGIIAQPVSFKIKRSCSFDDVEPSSNTYLFDPSDDANRIVSEIVDALGLTPNFLVRAAGVRNAVATVQGDQRYILYSTTFLEKFKGDESTRWAAYAVLAHEIGHHLNHDNFGETDMRRRKIYELEADRFSGSVLRMLGARLDQAQSGIESIEKEAESATHPAKAARREAVATGWKKRDEFLRARGEGALPNAPADSDGDGVPDNVDPCPDKTGEKRYAGCPDSDSDGVPDNKDDTPLGVRLVPKSEPDNCYYLNVQSEYFGFRTRQLTKAELDACNQCQSYIYSDGSTGYEDMNKSSCRLKKKIDDETDLGVLRNGTFLQLLSKEGSFYRVKDVSTGRVGYIAGKYAGISTLAKTSCQ